MEKSRLLEVFNALSKKEIRDLRKWLHSPAHNQREDVQLLFEYLENIGQEADEKLLLKETVYSSLFPDEAFDDAKFRQTTHFLLKAIEEYFIYQELRSDEVRAKTGLARVYRKKKIPKAFGAAMRDAHKEQEKYPFRNEHFHRNDFLLQLEEYSYRETQKRTAEMNLQDLGNALEVTFLADKLRYSYLMIAHQVVYKTEYDFGMLEEVLKYVEEKDFMSIPAIAVYYYGYKANVEKDNPSHFQHLKTTIIENESKFPQAERRDIYLMAINYLINRMNSGDSLAVKELFEFYKNGIEKEILIENESLSRFTFRNVVSLGLILKEYGFVEKFIPTYATFLESKNRDSIVHYSRALLHFERKDYETAMQLLMQVEYDDLLMNLSAKSMLIRMFYEEDELDALESLLESMRTYMQRKKVMGYHKSNFSNLIRMTKKLVKINPFNREQVEKLRKDVVEANPMGGRERNWLLQQIDAL
ncbi:MAG: hypothetical protein KDC24_08220 [Saprospiraceae bacterium]|nr:hypothetical protein [Saprospiraceae bacterium]